MAKNKVECPGCGSTQPAQRESTIYWCPKCCCQFDDSPDEGGDFDDRNPAARIEREERRRERRRQRREQRGY